MTEPRAYADRTEAGRVLASGLRGYAGRKDTVVLGIPRGGVPVAYEVARTLQAPLDVLVVRKLGLPEQPELAIGAIASGGIRILNRQLISELSTTPSTIDAVTRVEQRELERRERHYRGGRPAIDLRGRVVVLVDDGLATGASMKAAIAAARRRDAARLVVAVPVAQTNVCGSIAAMVDEMVCPMVVNVFFAVGQWYIDFSATTDEEVRRLLELSSGSREAA